MALMLHQKGKTQMKKKMYKEALDVLLMAEVHCLLLHFLYSLCDCNYYRYCNKPVELFNRNTLTCSVLN
jgi:hypothetical protein